MADQPTTRPSLLIRMRDARDADAWQEFVKLYAPMIYAFARKRGLQDSDAADLTQDVMRSVAGAIGRLEYDRKRGLFRSWLFTVVRNKLGDFRARRSRQLQGSGDTTVHLQLEEHAAPEQAEALLWDEEYQRQLLARAVELVRFDFQEASWQAFWQTAMEGKKAKEVAAGLGISVASVYMAKSRVTAQLRAQIQRLQNE